MPNDETAQIALESYANIQHSRVSLPDESTRYAKKASEPQEYNKVEIKVVD